MNLKKRNKTKVDLSNWSFNFLENTDLLDKWVKKQVSLSIREVFKQDPPNIRYDFADKMTLIVGIPLGPDSYEDVEYKCSLLDFIKDEFDLLDEHEINDAIHKHEQVLLKLLQYIRSQRVKGE